MTTRSAHPVAEPTLLTEKAQLEQLVKKQTPISLYLVNGIHLRGYLLGFDTYTLLLKSNTRTTTPYQLVYKHAISTLVTHVDNNSL